MYYNAWENDFSDSALVSILGEFDKGLDSLNLSVTRKKRLSEKFDKAKDIGIDLLKHSLPIAVKALTANVVDINQVTDAAIAELGEGYSKALITKYQKSKESLKEFREKLQEFVRDMTKGNTKFSGKPLVIFIDELDRCRPNFALEVLEKTKHFFNTKGIVFIYSFDKAQLGASIRALYGEMDVDGYLRRFFDLIYKLPSSDNDNFLDYLFDKYDIASYLHTRRNSQDDYDNIYETIKGLFPLFQFSLRTQEQIVTQLVFALLSTPPKRKLLPFALIILLILKAVNEKMYYKFISGHAQPEEIIDFIESKPESKEFFDKPIGNLCRGSIIGLAPTKDVYGRFSFPMLEEYTKKANETDASPELVFDVRIMRELINSDFRNPDAVMKNLTSKIEFITNFEEENFKDIMQD